MSGEMYIQDYSDKSFVLRGDGTKDHKEAIRSMKGKWNKSLKSKDGTFCGWIFANKRREEVEAWLKEVSDDSSDDSFLSSESEVEEKEKKEEKVIDKSKKRTKMRLSRLVSTILFEFNDRIEQDSEFYDGLLGTIAGEVNMTECVTCGHWQQRYEMYEGDEGDERCDQCGYNPSKHLS